MANLATACCCTGLCEFNSALTVTLSGVSNFCAEQRCRYIVGGHNIEIQTISVDGEYTVPLGPIAGVWVHADYEFIFSGTFMTARQYEFANNEECNVFEKNVTWDELLIQVNLDCETGEITLFQVLLDPTSEGTELISRPFDGEIYTGPKFIGDTLSNHNVCTEFGISAPPMIVADNGTAVAELAT